MYGVGYRVYGGGHRWDTGVGFRGELAFLASSLAVLARLEGAGLVVGGEAYTSW